MKLILDDIAAWRPLGNPLSEPSVGVPRLLIWHTMVGNLRGTENMFKQGGFDGVESTFGLGGAYDKGLDGVLWEWQRLDRQADAQFDANPLANSVECSDGGDGTRPFSAAQVVTSIRLGVRWCQETGRPPTEAQSWDGVGFGYHCLFTRWNKTNHSCPGSARIKQLRTIIWPAIAHELRGDKPTPPTRPPISGVEASVAPKFPLQTGWYFGPRSGPRESVSGYASKIQRGWLRQWQQQMRNRGWPLTADGLYGDETERVARQFQAEKKLGVDGLIGLHTWNAAWTTKVT